VPEGPELVRPEVPDRAYDNGDRLGDIPLRVGGVGGEQNLACHCDEDQLHDAQVEYQPDYIDGDELRVKLVLPAGAEAAKRPAAVPEESVRHAEHKSDHAREQPGRIEPVHQNLVHADIDHRAAESNNDELNKLTHAGALN